VLTDGSFSFDVAATGALSRLDVFTSINGLPAAASTGLFVATLKDSLNNVLGTYSQAVSSASANNIFTVDFSGAGDHLSVVYSLSSGNGTVGLSAATLAAVPEPGSLALGLIAAISLTIAGVRRRRAD
jgi:hypothetical protein